MKNSLTISELLTSADVNGLTLSRYMSVQKLVIMNRRTPRFTLFVKRMADMMKIILRRMKTRDSAIEKELSFLASKSTEYRFIEFVYCLNDSL